MKRLSLNSLSFKRRTLLQVIMNILWRLTDSEFKIPCPPKSFLLIYGVMNIACLWHEDNCNCRSNYTTYINVSWLFCKYFISTFHICMIINAFCWLIYQWHTLVSIHFFKNEKLPNWVLVSILSENRFACMLLFNFYL